MSNKSIERLEKLCFKYRELQPDHLRHRMKRFWITKIDGRQLFYNYELNSFTFWTTYKPYIARYKQEAINMVIDNYDFVESVITERILSNV